MSHGTPLLPPRLGVHQGPLQKLGYSHGRFQPKTFTVAGTALSYKGTVIPLDWSSRCFPIQPTPNLEPAINELCVSPKATFKGPVPPAAFVVMPNQAAVGEGRRAYLLVASDLTSRSVWLMRIQQAAEAGGPGDGDGGANAMDTATAAAQTVRSADSSAFGMSYAWRVAPTPRAGSVTASYGGSVASVCSSYDAPRVAQDQDTTQRSRAAYNEPFDTTTAAGTRAALPPPSVSADHAQQERIELDAIVRMRLAHETFEESKAALTAVRFVVTIHRTSLNGSLGFALAETQYGGDIVVSRVMEGGLAAGKLQPGDLVLSANGSKIDGMDHYQVQGLVAIGMTAILEIERGAKAPFEAGPPTDQREFEARERMRVAQAEFDASPRARDFASSPVAKTEPNISVTIAPVAPPRPAQPQVDMELEAMAKMKRAQADFEASRSAGEFGSDSFGEVETPMVGEAPAVHQDEGDASGDTAYAEPDDMLASEPDTPMPNTGSYLPVVPTGGVSGNRGRSPRAVRCSPPPPTSMPMNQASVSVARVRSNTSTGVGTGASWARGQPQLSAATLGRRRPTRSVVTDWSCQTPSCGAVNDGASSKCSRCRTPRMPRTQPMPGAAPPSQPSSRQQQQQLRSMSVSLPRTTSSSGSMLSSRPSSILGRVRPVWSDGPSGWDCSQCCFVNKDPQAHVCASCFATRPRASFDASASSGSPRSPHPTPPPQQQQQQQQQRHGGGMSAVRSMGSSATAGHDIDIGGDAMSIALTKSRVGFGISIGGANDDAEGRRVGFGLFLSEVKPESPAAQVPGLRLGMQVLSINDRDVTRFTVSAFKRQIVQTLGNTMRLKLRRNTTLYDKILAARGRSASKRS